MKEQVIELKSHLSKIQKMIANEIAMREIDLHEFNELQESLEDDERYKGWRERFRENIISYKEDNSFYEVDLPHFELILTKSLEQVKLINKSNSEPFKSNSPNNYIIEILQQKILTTESVIKGFMCGKEFCGNLTEDGFLEITSVGVKRKYGSLRNATYELWKRDIPSQWKFWKVHDQPLEYYRSQIKKM